jgi:DNA-binding NarL/FixJ family response regulator
MTAAPSHPHPPSSSKTGRKRILIVDDHPMMRAGLAQLISKQGGLEVCCEAGSAVEAMAAISRFEPDLILADITMKGGSGLEFIKDVLAVHGEIPILVVSMHDEKVYAERALRAGASGYIMKEESAEFLLAAIQRVLEGGVYLSETMSARILKNVSRPTSRNKESPLQNLTDREFEVFQLIGQGKTSEEIARQLRISPRTVDVYRSQIKEKLQLKSGTALVHYAVQWAGTEGSEPKAR